MACFINPFTWEEHFFEAYAVAQHSERDLKNGLCQPEDAQRIIWILVRFILSLSGNQAGL